VFVFAISGDNAAGDRKHEHTDPVGKQKEQVWGH